MSRKSSPPSIQTPVLPHTPCCSWPAQALFWRRQLWMPMAIWYLNKASVYIKTHMPFSAKFLGCFEEREELEQNTLNYQILHERERYHRSLKRSSQSNCGLELRVIFFPSFLFFNLNSLMHWSYKSAACEREGFATGSFTRRMTGMQHVFQTWIRVPQADPQSKQPSLCH